MAVSYSKICFLIILNLIFKSKALAHTLVTTPSPDSESKSTHSTFNPNLLNSLKTRLHTFGSVNLSGSDEIKTSSAPTLGSEAPVTDTTDTDKSTEDVQHTEDVKSTEDAQANEFTEATDSPHSEVSEPKISEHKASYLEELLTNRPEQRYTGAYQPREKEFSVSANFANFLSKQSRDMLKKCTKTPHEFVLIVDESGSISTYNWNNKVKDFVLLISSAVAEVNSYNKLSIVQYSRTPKLVMDSETLDKLSLNGIGRVIDDMFSAPRTHGTTYTGEALQFAREKILDKQGQFVLELSESTAPLSKKNKIVILLTDGGSKDPEKAHRESLIHRFNGVDLYVFGVGSFNEAECRKLVGCSPEGDCNYFFHAKWESIIDYLQKMVISMCRDTGRNATCLENWSEFSECSAKCGGGIMKATLLNFTTVAEATVGEDGIKGLSCEEQYRNVSEKYERCNTFPCKDHLVNINQHSTHPKETRHEETTDSRDSELKQSEQKPNDSLDGEEVGSMRTVQYRRKTAQEEKKHEEEQTVDEPDDEEEETLEATPVEDTEEETPPPSEETDDTPSSTRQEMATPIRATRYTGTTSEERNEKLNEILRNLEAHKESMRASTHHETHPHPHTQTRHKPVETEHSHHHHTPEPTSHSEESSDSDGDGTDLTNLAGFDGTGRVPFHLISGKDHKEVKVEKVLDEEEKQFEETEKEREKEREREREHEKEHEPTKPTNHIRGNEKVMRDQDSQTERTEDEADEAEETEEPAPRTRDSSTNTVNMTDAATNTLNMRDASTNTVNMSDAATNTVHTRDMGTNTDGRAESAGDNTQETIKRHVPKYKKPTDHRPHHTTDLKEVAQQAEMAISTTKMKFKRFLENEHVRKFAAVAIVIFLSGLSISVFSYIFLRGKEPTPHLFDPSDQEFMNAGDGDDVEPSENFQVSNMEDGIWA